ncbi:protein Niban 1-like [Anguilla anguilla]|uniref:protein Niban 1-like n=1 Tax=Anguilla anguilla TaxID=7936 RepID=UPI0015AB43CA|nr:protein Niban 1-like [Anguilla anguilla]
MGVSSSSLLDESKSNYIKGRTEAELKNFSPHYRRQYSVAYFSQLQEEVEQHRTGHTHLLKQRAPPEDAEILYEESVLYFDDSRKWKERYVVVRANYSLECHDSNESFTKGAPPRHKIQPTGGSVLVSEEQYTAMVDKAFPDPNSVKEESSAPIVVMPGQFPIYLHLPYHRDAYFCFHQEDRQSRFISILTDCIRHQNHDFLKKTTCDVQAFLKAIQSYRQEKGHYESWDMLLGSDVQVLANLVMEELLPSLQTELLPRLKGKKTERKRVWFATVEAAYALVQDQLREELATLREECSASAKQQEALIRSNMDQIISSRTFLEGKLQAMVSEPAVRYCSEHVQPYLTSILEELMGPVSAGFQEARQVCEGRMDRLCRDFQENRDGLKEALGQLRRTSLRDCYRRVDVLREQLHELRNRFKFSNTDRLVQSAQTDIQQLMENVAYTFELLLQTALKDGQAKPGSVMEKAKLRVLKQYDYDSSTVRKRIFQEALVDITLPAIKRSLAPSCKLELQKFDQYIFADYTNFIQVENVYEDILLKILTAEVSKVVKEAASLKKHNLFVDSTDLQSVSQASLSERGTPPRSAPSSPAKAPPPSTQQPTPPLQGNGLLESQALVDAPGGGATEKEAAPTDPQTDQRPPSPSVTSAGAKEDPSEISPVSPGLSGAPEGTSIDGVPVMEVTSAEQPAADKPGNITPSLAIQESDTVHLVTPTERKDNSTVHLDTTGDEKEHGTAQSDIPAEGKDSGTVHLSSHTEEKESDVVLPDSTAEVKDIEVACPVVEVEASSDLPEDLKGSETLFPLIINTESKEQSGTFCLDVSTAESTIPTITHPAEEVQEPPLSLNAGITTEVPEGGAIAQQAECPAGIQEEAASLSEECPSEVKEEYEEEEPALDCVRAIRDLVVEIIEVEDLVPRQPDSNNP